MLTAVGREYDFDAITEQMLFLFPSVKDLSTAAPPPAAPSQSRPYYPSLNGGKGDAGRYGDVGRDANSDGLAGCVGVCCP